MASPHGRVKGLKPSTEPANSATNPPSPPWLIIVYDFEVTYPGSPSCAGALMRSISALLACFSLLAGSAALADSRVFIVANQADGYGVDQCLARGDKCGAHAAHSYCQSRNFAEATAYRRVDPDEITGTVPAVGRNCSHPGCIEYVAITCQR
jgi:hypothetical protein